MSLTAPERETVISMSDADELVHIFTAQAKYVRRLRNDDRFTEVRSGEYGTSIWAEFTIPATQWNPRTGAKRRSSGRKPPLPTGFAARKSGTADKDTEEG